ncbi:MAG: hypothetical protein ABSE25_05290 [Syntrophorhabdales bacterium]
MIRSGTLIGDIGLYWASSNYTEGGQMGSRINTEESNEILRILMKALFEARDVNKNSDPETGKVIAKLLKQIEDKLTYFFRENVDRRAVPRDQPILSDMAGYYKISSSFY